MSDDDQKIDDVMAFDSDSGFVAMEPDSAAPQAQSGQDAASMDQLRGLLMGPLASDMQMKMNQLSQRLDGSMLELDRRTADNVSMIETQFKERLNAMVAEISELQDRQATILRNVKEELDASNRSLREKMEDLGERLTQERAEELQAIRDEFEQFSESLTSRLDCESQVLRSELVDRNSLSAALSEVAMRLSSDSDTDSDFIVAETAHAEIDLEAAIDAAAGKI